MPIQQKRVIALINAALDAYQAVNRIQTQIKSHMSSVQSGLMSPEYAFHELSIFILDNNTIFKRYNETIHIIQMELNWFSTHAQDNATRAESMRKLREQRRTDGILPEPKRRRKHIPKSLFETEEIHEPNTFTPDKESYRPQVKEATEQEWKEWDAAVAANPTQPTHPLTIKPAFDPDKYKDDPNEKPKLPDDYDPSALPPPGSPME